LSGAPGWFIGRLVARRLLAGAAVAILATACTSAPAPSHEPAQATEAPALPAASVPPDEGAAADWAPLTDGQRVTTGRGVTLVGQPDWEVTEPTDGDVLAVLATEPTPWGNGADTSVAHVLVIRVDLPAGGSLDDLAKLYWPESWVAGTRGGGRSLRAEWGPDASSTWGGSLTLVEQGGTALVIAVQVPSGPDYAAQREAGEAIAASVEARP
jgi:hypothetical protein